MKSFDKTQLFDVDHGIEPITFYHRPTARKNLKLLSDLKKALIWFLEERDAHGVNHYARFMSIMREATQAFDATSAERLAEFAGVSSSTIRRIRKGHLPSASVEYAIATTLVEACEFYLSASSEKAEKAEWIRVPNSAQATISTVSLLLNDLLSLASGANEPELTLSAIERAELVAVLETALLLLKAPMVEKGFLKRLKQTLRDVAKRVAERQVELAMSSACAAAASALALLLAKYLK